MIFSGLMLLFSACETKIDDPAGPRDEAVVPAVENLNPAVYDVYDLENTFIKFDLTLPSSGVSQANVLVSFGRGKERKEVATVSSFPATGITIPLTDVVQALGMSLDEIEAADVFTFEVQTIQDGKSYFSSAAFRAAVVCGYEVANVTGSYNSSSDWGEGSVTLEADPNDEFTVYVNGLPDLDSDLGDEVGPLVLKVNPLDFSVQVPSSTVASGYGPYTNWTLTGSGTLNTCDGTYELMLTATVDQGSFGAFDFVFTKQ